MRSIGFGVFIVLSAVLAPSQLASGETIKVLRSDIGMKRGYGIKRTGLNPRYPDTNECSPLTSLYASMKDIDGTRRNEAHSGVDGGLLGEPILAPAPGTVRAVWKANWRWGDEGALLIRHSREDLNLDDGPSYYYSAFYHLKLHDLRALQIGQRIERGQKLAHVFRPGGQRFYLPEVHWEVYEVENDSKLNWGRNKFGGKFWINNTARLIDPLFMLGRHVSPEDGTNVEIQPFKSDMNYSTFRGFSYILPCKKR